QVDVSIRYAIGSIPILITVECRHRARVEDSCWIEQLAERERALRANATIAVSISGFGEPARKKAEALRIVLRTVDSIQDLTVVYCFRHLYVTPRYLTFRLISVGMIWPDGKFPSGMPEKLDLELEDAWASPAFLEGPERASVSISELFQENWAVFGGDTLP